MISSVVMAGFDPAIPIAERGMLTNEMGATSPRMTLEQEDSQ